MLHRRESSRALRALYAAQRPSRRYELGLRLRLRPGGHLFEARDHHHLEKIAFDEAAAATERKKGCAKRKATCGVDGRWSAQLDDNDERPPRTSSSSTPVLEKASCPSSRRMAYPLNELEMRVEDR